MSLPIEIINGGSAICGIDCPNITMAQDAIFPVFSITAFFGFFMFVLLYLIYEGGGSNANNSYTFGR